MDLKEIRASGLLELYVLGECTRQESETVEKALSSFPELKQDLYEIGAALELYAGEHKVAPSAGAKENLLRQVSGGSTEVSTGARIKTLPPHPGMSWPLVGAAAGMLLFAALYALSLSQKANIEKLYNDYQVQCDSIQTMNELQFAVLNQLQDVNNRMLNIEPTGTFSNTELILIYNDVTRQNFVQVMNLPAIDAQQSFQLWSLKPGIDPIPLSVFQGDEGRFIPVSFEDDTQTYAITIEPRGGSQVPTLENLIGTVNVTS